LILSFLRRTVALIEDWANGKIAGAVDLHNKPITVVEIIFAVFIKYPDDVRIISFYRKRSYTDSEGIAVNITRNE